MTLGVPPYASAEEIKAAYKKLALQYHPDRNTEPGAEEKFKSIAAAYNVIGNKKRRQQYDMERQFARGAGMGGGSGGGGMPNMGGAWQQQYHAHSRSPHHAHGSSSYQRMSKEEADELFREMFGSIRVEDIFRAFEEEMRRGNSSAAAGAGGGTGFLRPGASSSARGGFHGFFSRGGGAASSAKSSSTRVYFDADGNRMEEHTFTSPSGTYYRVSQQTSSSSGSHANSSGGGPSASAAAGPGHNGHPFFSRGPGGTGMNDPFERVFSTASHGRGAAHAEQQQEPLGFGAMPNSGMHPPPSMDIRMITFWATVRLISWIIIITTIIWMLLSTMLAHPILAFAILLLMAAGRRGRF